MGAPWLGWCILIIMLGVMGKSCIDDYRKRKAGVSGTIPFWASLPGIILFSFLVILLANLGLPRQVLIIVAAAYCIYVFYAAQRSSQEKE
ncbi:hypothetical protein [uncultured Neglectibacter sp.]|uniref:hypothetical protein n=1 Tax=uncultured Neglectibacter sp. TaxID=1924108 RepID=UPI0034DED67E